MSNKKKKVFVALSGGVDSSVSAYLLKKDGFNVVGVFIGSYNVDGCEEKDAADARCVAEHLKIPFYIFDMREEYFSRVVEYMIDGYRRGLTPNPDIMCNKEIKFGLFLERAKRLGADYIATGHYVQKRDSKIRMHANQRINRLFVDSNKFVVLHRLYQSKDKNKDQSYFLWTLTQDRLKYCIFPVGGYTKPEVREIAKRAGLSTAEKKDSQGICFLGKVKLPDFLKKYIEPEKGEIVDTEGNVLGEHEGVQFYTIGQRHIGVSLKSKTDGGPYYIVEKDIETNTLVVAEGDDNPAFFKNEVELKDVNFITNNLRHTTNNSIKVFVRIRYRQKLVPATLICRKSSVVSCKLEFDSPVKFVAPGQSAVFYLPVRSQRAKEGSIQFELLGGGVII